MKYLKAIFFSFLVVFFADQMLPGIKIMHPTKLPHLGADLFFALSLGVLNAMIYPLVRLLKGASPVLKTCVAAVILNFAIYGLLNLLPVGIHVESIEGYLMVAIAVSVASIIINLSEMRGDKPPSEDFLDPPPGL